MPGTHSTGRHHAVASILHKLWAKNRQDLTDADLNSKKADSCRCQLIDTTLIEIQCLKALDTKNKKFSTAGKFR